MAQRLIEERLAKGWSASDMARHGGVTPAAIYYYEKGRRPDSEFLAAIAAAGADVLYILTGQRSAGTAAAPAEADPLTSDEEWVLDCYRTATGEARRLIEQAARVAKEQVAPRQVTRPARVAPGRVKKVA